MCIRLFLCSVFCWLTPTALHAQAPSTLPNAQRQYLNLELDSCRNMLQKIPPNPSTFYLMALATATDIFLHDDNTRYKAHSPMEDTLLDSLNSMNFDDKNTLFLKAEIKLQWAILKIRNEENFAGFWSLRQAYLLSKKNLEAHPDFMPAHKTLGTLQILFGILPDKYNWLLAIFGIDGDVQQGLNELRRVAESSQTYGAEAHIMLGMIWAYLLDESQRAVVILDKVYQQNPTLLPAYANILALVKNTQGDKALALLDKNLSSPRAKNQLPQLLYIRGEIMMQQWKWHQAIENYLAFLHLQSKHSLKKDALFKIGVSYYIQKKTVEADTFFSRARQSGQTKTEADNNAQYALTHTPLPDPSLFKIRYATDGGYFKNALKTMNETDTTELNTHDKCEFYYRKGRLFHKTNDTPKAIINYKKTIARQQGDHWYFAPNAALQLGEIYIEASHNKEAQNYLKMVLRYTDYPYQESIRRKARMLLKSLN